jgi:hypothetical protein
MANRRIGLKRWLSKEKNRESVRSCGLVGCPEGGWGETQQAMRRIQEELPFRDERLFTVREVIDALYLVDKSDRYQLKED